MREPTSSSRRAAVEPARTAVVAAVASTLAAACGAAPPPASPPPAAVEADASAGGQSDAATDESSAANEPRCDDASDCNNKGAFAMMAGQRDEGASLFERACELGSGAGCLNLGRQLYGGQSVARDRERARELFEAACDLEEAEGCTNAGLMAADGEAGASDDVRALELFERACRLGDPRGCGNAGVLLYGEDAAPPDLERAVDLFERACDGGARDGCFNLAVAAARGRGTTADTERARELFGRLCEEGDESACRARQELGAPASPADPRIAAFSQQLDVASLTADGLTVRGLECGLDSGGLFAAMGVVGALAERKPAFDRCAPKGGAARVVFDFSGGRVTAAKAEGAQPRRAGRCAARAVAKARIPFTGRCRAVILLGDEGGAGEAADVLERPQP